MANRFSYRHGQRLLVKCAVDSTTVVEIGDMVYLATDDVRPVGDYTWNTNLETTQGAVAALFMGIAVEKSASGDTDEIDVDISSDAVYQFDVASATYEVGNPLGPDEDADAASPGALMDQQLEVAAAAASIARAVERKTAASTLLHVRFASAYAPVNTNAVVG